MAKDTRSSATLLIRLKDELSKPLSKIGKIFQEFKIRAKDSDSALGSVVFAMRGLARVGSTVIRTVGAIGSAFGRLRQTLFNVKTLFATVFAGFVVRQLFRSIADVDTKVREIATLLGIRSRDALKKLSADIRTAAVAGGQDFVTALTAAYQAVSAGVPVKNLLTFLRSANKLAVGGVATIAEAVEVLNSVLRGYGLTVDEIERVSDTLFTTVRLGRTTISELATVIGRLAPIAKSAGLTIEEMGAAVAVLTGTLGRTELAVTALQGLLNTMERIAMNKQQRELIASLGFEFTPDDLRRKGILKFLQDIDAQAKKVPSGLRALGLEVTAFQGIAILSANGGKELEAALEAMREKAGATDDAFAIMSEGIQFAFDRMFLQLKNLVVNIGDNLVPALTTFFNKIFVFLKDLEKETLVLRDLFTAAFRPVDRDQFETDAQFTEAQAAQTATQAQVQRVLRANVQVILEALKTGAMFIFNALIEGIKVGWKVAAPIITTILSDALGSLFNKIPGLAFLTSKQRQEINAQRDDLQKERERILGFIKQSERIISESTEKRAALLAGLPDVSRASDLSSLQTEFDEFSRLEELIRDFNDLRKHSWRQVRELQRAENDLNEQLEASAETVEIIDHQFEEATKQLSESAQAMAEFASQSGIARDSNGDLIPGVNELTDALIERNRVMEETEALLVELGLRQEEVKEEIEETTEAADEQRSIIDRLRGTWNSWKQSISEWTEKAKEAFDAMKNLRSFADDERVFILQATGQDREAALLAQQINALKSLAELEKELADAGELGTPLGDRKLELRRQRLEIEREAIVVRFDLKDVTEELADAEDDYEDSVRDVDDALAAKQISEEEARLARDKARESTLETIEAIKMRLTAMREEHGLFTITIDETIEKLGELEERLRRLPPETQVSLIARFVEGFESGLSVVNDLAIGTGNVIGSSIGQAIDDIIDRTKSWKEIFADFVRGALADMAKMIARLLLIRLLSAFFPGAGFGGVVGFASGGPVLGPNVNRDVVDAKLTPGEYVFSKPAVDKVGMSFMDWFHSVLTGKIRRTPVFPQARFQTGGAVAAQSGTRSSASPVSLAVMVPNEQTAKAILQGGREAFIRFIEEHASKGRSTGL